MKSIRIKFPIGLTARLVDELKPIAIRNKTDFIGVEDNFEEVLAKYKITEFEIL